MLNQSLEKTMILTTLQDALSYLATSSSSTMKALTYHSFTFILEALSNVLALLLEALNLMTWLTTQPDTLDPFSGEGLSGQPKGSRPKKITFLVDMSAKAFSPSRPPP